MDEERHQTLYCEPETILIDPLTTSSNDSIDLEALTPNHILLLKMKPFLLCGFSSVMTSYLEGDGGRSNTWQTYYGSNG